MNETLLGSECVALSLFVCVCPVLGHVFGELHEVLSFLKRQQRQDLAVAIHAVFLLAQTHVEVGALPQVAHVGGVVPNGCGGQGQGGIE